MKHLNLNKYNVESPVKVCYLIDQKTKKRIASLIKKSSILSASMLVDIAVNVFIDDIEAQNLELVLNLNDK